MEAVKPLRVVAPAAQTEIGGGLMPRMNRALRIAPLALCVALGVVGAANAALPSDYTELTYIASSGSQYINTGIAPKTTTRVVCDFQYTVVNGSAQCGWGSTNNKEAFLFGVGSDNTFRVSVSGNFTASPTGVAADTARHAFDLSTSALKLDGTAFTNASSSPFSNAASGNTLYLFALHAGWSPYVVNKASMRIYSCQIYDSDTLVRDFIPACRISDMEVGLYDSVNNMFYKNEGTGSFTMGEVVSASDRLEVMASIDGIGSPSPAYGETNGLAAADSFIVSCGVTPVADDAGTMQYYCTGWKLYDATNAVVSTGSETSFTYVHPDPAAYRRLEWQWEVSAYRGTIAAGYGGSVSQSGTDWFAAGTSVTVTATPNAGNVFKRWAGTLPDGVSATSASVTFTPTAPFDMTAVFETVGCSDLVFLNEKMSSHWHTATNCVIDLPIMFPDGASSATLSIAGPGYSAQYAISSGTEQYTLSLPAASSPSTENVYDLSLAFNDSASTVRTAKLGLIYGYGATTTGWTRCLAPAGTKAWSKTDGVAVIPIPYGTTSFTVALNGGEATETDTGLDGAAGWYPLRLRGSAIAELAAVTPEGNLAANLSGDGAGFFLIVR